MVYGHSPMTRMVGLASGIAVKSRRMAERRLKRLGITYPQFGALTAISEIGGGPQKLVAERLEIDVNTAMVVCSALEAKGLATRKRDPRDSRALVVSLSAAGRSLLAKARVEAGRLIARLPEGLPPEKMDAALEVLESIYAAMKAAEEAEGA